LDFVFSDQIRIGLFDLWKKIVLMAIFRHSAAVLQSDLLQLLQPFGMVSKIVMLRAKNQVGHFFFPAFD
jgi:hypothetical protein